MAYFTVIFGNGVGYNHKDFKGVNKDVTAVDGVVL